MFRLTKDFLRLSRSTASPRIESGECEALWPLLSAWIDEELTAAESKRVEAHVDHCTACRRELDSLLDCCEVLKSVDEVNVPAEVQAAIRSVIQTEWASADGCERIQPLLSAFLDAELSVQERNLVSTHTHSCHKCSRQLILLRRTAGLVEKLPALEPPPGLRAKVLSCTTGRAHRLPRLSPASTGLLAAAGLILLYFPTSHPPKQSTVVAEAGMRSPGSVEAPAPNLPLPGALAPSNRGDAPGQAPRASSTRPSPAASSPIATSPTSPSTTGSPAVPVRTPVPPSSTESGAALAPHEGRGVNPAVVRGLDRPEPSEERSTGSAVSFASPASHARPAVVGSLRITAPLPSGADRSGSDAPLHGRAQIASRPVSHEGVGMARLAPAEPEGPAWTAPSTAASTFAPVIPKTAAIMPPRPPSVSRVLVLAPLKNPDSVHGIWGTAGLHLAAYREREAKLEFKDYVDQSRALSKHSNGADHSLNGRFELKATLAHGPIHF